MGAVTSENNAFEVGADERVLFAFTHPDDEMSAAAMIWRLQRTGVPVRVLWTHSTDLREAESRDAMSKIGVGGDQLSFHCGCDGAIVDEIPRLRDEMNAVVEEFKPTRVVTHAFEQGHLDHDTTNLLVHLSFDGPTFEAPFYHTYLSRFPVIYRFSLPEGEQMQVMTGEEVAKKWEMLDCYPSQTIRRNLKLYYLAKSFGLRKDDLIGTERLRLQTHFDYSSPNHPVDVAKKIEASDTWRRWLRAVEDVQ